MVDLAGQQIGNYHLAERIASGGMADIYLARHTYLNRRVAVKILHSDINESGQKAFLLEARLIESLKHPNIVPIYDFGIHTGGGRSFAYLVMEYAFGNLADRHPPGTVVPFAAIRTYVSAIASALNYAHTLGIVHRDVKPSNILTGENGTVLLSDFGIATLTNAAQDRTISGTPAYMAPEQVTGGIITAAADQYALGVVIYQWLCGFSPFMSGNPTELMLEHVRSTPTSLRVRIPSMPAKIDEIVLKALAKNPEQRFPSVKSFADTLDEPLRLAALTQPLQNLSGSVNPYPPRSGGVFPPPSTLVSQIKEPTVYPANASPIPYSEPGIQTPAYTGMQPGDHTNGISYPDLVAWSQSAATPYYQGPPTITGYKGTGNLFAAQPGTYQYVPPNYFPAPAQQKPNSLLLFLTTMLSLLATPFIFTGRLITQRNSPNPPNPYASTTQYASTNAPTQSALKNFCVMYHHEDRLWAEWVAWHLEENGFTCILPDWDFQAGSNFDLEMTRASFSAERIVVILSPNYLRTSENLRTVRRVLSSRRDTVLPVVVHEYDHTFKHPLKDLVALNLVNLSKETAQARLVSVARRERQKPLAQPVFPPEFDLMKQPQTNVPVNQPVPLPVTQTNMISNVNPVVVPTPVPVPLINGQQNQTMQNIYITLRLDHQELGMTTISANQNDATVIQSDQTVMLIPGDNQVTIEQNALKVTAFLRAMREYVITNPEFGKHYSDAGRLDQLFATLASDLAMNFQRLEEARRNARHHPGRRQFQDDIDTYLQGLANTAQDIEQAWREFRIATTAQIEDLQQQVELKSEQEEQEQQERTQKLGESTQDEGKEERNNWFKTALNGLVQFKDFLVVATDIDKAATQWSPAVMEALHHAFNALSMLHF